ncbi:MAG: hypothetical protein K8S98_00190 [Planctomycetes bacterium]|nr:hypothetical protein [Planctomycetota bacterium]
MLRFAFAAALAALSFSPVPQAHTQLAPAPCAQVWKHEPVLTYDVAGSTLIGPLYLHLAVYNDGHAIVSRTSTDPDPGAAQTSSLSAAEVQQLRADLIAAGADSLCDDTLQANDAPLSTITYFRGTTNGTTHTFSYWAGFGGSYAAVEQVVTNLIATKFPNF